MSKVMVGKCLLPNLLKRSHMTQTDLAVITGMQVSQISMYINHKRMMSLPTAMLISWALKCHIEELYEWKVK